MPEQMPDGSVRAKAPRDLRLDAFRGLCLAMIFINHVPGTIYENLTSRNFGFSDAAEGFVLMSGLAAGLAYSNGYRGRLSWPAVGRVWRRAWTLYLVHAMMTLAGLGIISFGVLHLGTADLLQHQNFDSFLIRPLGTHIGMPLMSYQLGYVNILPMYMVLLLIAPPMLWLAVRRPFLLWAMSGALWLAAGYFSLNMPNYPTRGGWFFNPVSWQFIFSTGLLTGVALKQGRRFLPVWRPLQIICAVFVIVAAVCTLNKQAGLAFGHLMWLIQNMGAHYLFTIFDKTLVSGPRLVHILALAYLLSTLPFIRDWAASRSAAPLVLLGRNALPVFAAGTLLALSAQVVKAAAPASLALDSALIFGGLALQFAFAWSLERLRLPKQA